MADAVGNALKYLPIFLGMAVSWYATVRCELRPMTKADVVGIAISIPAFVFVGLVLFHYPTIVFLFVGWVAVLLAIMSWRYRSLRG